MKFMKNIKTDCVLYYKNSVIHFEYFFSQRMCKINYKFSLKSSFMAYALKLFSVRDLKKTGNSNMICEDEISSYLKLIIFPFTLTS